MKKNTKDVKVITRVLETHLTMVDFLTAEEWAGLSDEERGALIKFDESVQNGGIILTLPYQPERTRYLHYSKIYEISSTGHSLLILLVNAGEVNIPLGNPVIAKAAKSLIDMNLKRFYQFPEMRVVSTKEEVIGTEPLPNILSTKG